MHHLAAERQHPLERRREVRHGEVRQREAVAGAGAALVHADRHRVVLGLPAAAFVGAARLERRAEQLLPEAAGPRGVVGGKLDQERRHTLNLAVKPAVA